MKRKLLLITLILNTFCYSQIDSIQLPKNGHDSFNRKTKHFLIHITSNEEIYFNTKKITFWDEISSEIRKQIRHPKKNAVNDIVIYADKSLDYYILNRVKSEIGKVWEGYIHYMSNDFKSENCLTYYIKGSPISQKYKSSNWIYGYDIIFTKKQRTLEEEVVFSDYRTSVEWPILAVWQSDFLSVFYDMKIEKVKSFLKNTNYKGLVLRSDKFFLLNDYKIHLDNVGEVDKLVNENDILFVDASFSNFENYFKVMNVIQKKRYKVPNHGELRKPFIIEVPEIFNSELKDKGLNLFK